MEKDYCPVVHQEVPNQIKKFAARLPEEQRIKCMKSLDVVEKAGFWKAVMEVQAQSTNLVPLPSLPTSNNICAHHITPPNLEEANDSMPVVYEVRCDPLTNLGADAPKNKWELSFVAPIIDEEGVPSPQFFSRLMKGEIAVKEPEKEKTPFLRSTGVQREIARKLIENNGYLNDAYLEEDQEAVITEFKRVWRKEKERVECNKKFCINDECLLSCLSIGLYFGIVMLIAGCVMFGCNLSSESGLVIIIVGSAIIVITVILLICMCCPFCMNSFGTEKDFSSTWFGDDLRESMKPCVRQRVKDWRRKKEWRWLLTSEERREEERIDKIEDARKKKEENEKLSPEAEIEMERLMKMRNLARCDGGARNIQATGIFETVVAVDVETSIISKEK
eukprot:MONOS_2934.1-p1 / transcript=MONOS_2934.1 / gene=MONOS_2934 / organism=Monocercomonoides_exilis_PA203 / gene_product=unspecified product / transcript_product=unspecified product / location=Mono_scaffold00064:83006-84235(+) / protein_length=390 / sequence_SO=supercontig / SO=protein_coding / is_pseudo=false